MDSLEMRLLFDYYGDLLTDRQRLCLDMHYNQDLSLAEIAQECGVSGSRIMGGGFGGCTINLVKEELYEGFIARAKAEFNARYGHEPMVYDVVISDGSRRL